MTQSFTSFNEFKRRYPIRPSDPGALLGSGSYGRVIKVEDQLETEWVAIKISEFKGADTKSLKAEVELAQRLPRQANIARYDACHRLETDTSVCDFAVMKYYPDGNLADLLRHERLTPTQLYEITQGILHGLQHLHQSRIVHRDFKPANILISRDNSGRFIPKIADFGLSKLVSNDELDSSDFDLSDGRGTPSYKAPEQIEGSRVSFNLDLWAFGVILYEMLTGEKPFRADPRNASEQSVRREIEKKIVTVELPAQLGQIVQPYRAMIERCLVHDIHKRVRKVPELLDLLDNIPGLLTDAKNQFNQQAYEQALALYEQVLVKRENHAEAEAGVAQCQAAIERQRINQLVAEADKYLTLQQFERAKDTYELILIRDAQNQAAIWGRELCLAQLQPRSQNDLDKTDVYEEKTDVYVAPVLRKQTPIQPKPDQSVVAKPVAAKTPVEKTFPKSEAIQQPEIKQPVQSPKARTFPWLIAAPVVAGLVFGGWNLFSNANETTEVGNVVKPGSSQKAGVGLSAIRSPLVPIVEKTVLVGSPVEEKKAALTKRVDIALVRARQAFTQNDYKTALMLVTSAQQLDPTRQDVLALHTAVSKAVQKNTSVEDKLPTPVTSTAEPLKVASSTPEAEKPKPTESAARENAVNPKPEAQEKYDQLMEEGMKAITGSNNKAKAIATFTEAQTWAKKHDLIMTKSDVAYTNAMNRAKSYFEREEFEGAKGWYLVAQSLKDTEEVKRKIKQCTNQ